MPKQHFTTTCPLCQGEEVFAFFTQEQMPIYCNVLWPTKQEAINAPRGDIELVFCENCGHIFNRRFDPTRVSYAQDYENSLHHSQRFQEYAESIARSLIEKYDLRRKSIIEIGCGGGEFLKLLCDIGDNVGIGFDPSNVAVQTRPASGANPAFVRDEYSEKYADHAADLYCCRHVLEHLYQPAHLLAAIAASIDAHSEAVLFFEVPNARFILDDLAIWDIIYEHYSYFGAPSLRFFFRKHGFREKALYTTFEGQYLCIEAVPADHTTIASPDGSHVLSQLTAAVEHFAHRCRELQRRWMRTLQEITDIGENAVLWGAGSKGVTFLNSLGEAVPVHYVVDINPRKQGKYIAGTGQQIVAPEFLRKHPPATVIVMNPTYKQEIQAQLAELELSPRLLVAMPESEEVVA